MGCVEHRESELTASRKCSSHNAGLVRLNAYVYWLSSRLRKVSRASHGFWWGAPDDVERPLVSGMGCLIDKA